MTLKDVPCCTHPSIVLLLVLVFAACGNNAVRNNGGIEASVSDTGDSPVSIRLTPESITIAPGETTRLTTTVEPPNAPVTWSSSNSSVAAVDSSGLVTASQTAGQATITAAVSETTNATCQVTVEQTTDPNSEGWTVVTPSEDTRVVYVSSSLGSNSNDGLSPEMPVKTIGRGAQLVRNGYPDHLLLKRGDQWTDETLGDFKGGRSATEPLVLSYYGDEGDRPLIRASHEFINHNGHVRSNLSLIGLSIVSYRMDPSDPAYDGTTATTLRLVGGGDNILIEDCRLQYVQLIVQSYEGDVYRNFRLRRSILIDNYALGTTTGNDARPQGLFANGVEGLLIEECVFDHNGWNENVPTAGANMYNHNIYIQVGNQGNEVTVRGNIITRASSHGVHGRPAGIYEDNLLVRNSISLQIGFDGVPLAAGTMAVARHNVILHGKRMDPNDSSNPRSRAVWGIELADLGAASITLERNIVSQRDDDGVAIGIASVNGVTYTDNVQYRWGGGIGDTTNEGWPHPERDVASYHESLGREATLQAFLQRARDRGLHEWPEEYAAAAVNSYVRAGFDMGE